MDRSSIDPNSRRVPLYGGEGSSKRSSESLDNTQGNFKKFLDDEKGEGEGQKDSHFSVQEEKKETRTFETTAQEGPSKGSAVSPFSLAAQQPVHHKSHVKQNNEEAPAFTSPFGMQEEGKGKVGRTLSPEINKNTDAHIAVNESGNALLNGSVHMSGNVSEGKNLPVKEKSVQGDAAFGQHIAAEGLSTQGKGEIPLPKLGVRSSLDGEVDVVDPFANQPQRPGKEIVASPTLSTSVGITEKKKEGRVGVVQLGIQGEEEISSKQAPASTARVDVRSSLGAETDAVAPVIALGKEKAEPAQIEGSAKAAVSLEGEIDKRIASAEERQTPISLFSSKRGQQESMGGGGNFSSREELVVDPARIVPIPQASASIYEMSAAQVQAPVATRANINALYKVMVEQISSIEQSGKTETVVVLQHPPMFAGSRLVISEVNTAPGQYNIAFENLTVAAQNLLDLQQNRAQLMEELAKRGYTVPIFTTTTYNEPRLTVATGGDFQGRDQEESREEQDGRGGSQKERNSG